MPLKDIFRRHARTTSKSSKASTEKSEKSPSPPPQSAPPQVTDFKFIRSDTLTQEELRLPTHPDDPKPPTTPAAATRTRSSTTAARLKEHFNFGGHRRTQSSSSVASKETPQDWEKRASVLVAGTTPDPAPRVTTQDDATIQRALQLYDEGDLTGATRIFEQLAKPPTSNPTAQVFYGLALRHGWGVEASPQEAVHYLELAAANSSAIEQGALGQGLKKGGKARGELALAIYELGNSYRQGWGVARDMVKAREYYEVAAGMGEVDAMNCAAWCWEHGEGGRKDRGRAARWYRRAERRGGGEVGNSWIWKEKYDKDDDDEKKDEAKKR